MERSEVKAAPAASVPVVDEAEVIRRCEAAFQRGYMDGMAKVTAGMPVVEASSEHTIKCLPDGVLFDAFGNPRTRYIRVTYDGADMVIEPAELESFKAEASDDGPDPHKYTDVYLSEREFDELPEFDGF